MLLEHKANQPKHKSEATVSDLARTLDLPELTGSLGEAHLRHSEEPARTSKVVLPLLGRMLSAKTLRPKHFLASLTSVTARLCRHAQTCRGRIG